MEINFENFLENYYGILWMIKLSKTLKQWLFDKGDDLRQPLKNDSNQL